LALGSLNRYRYRRDMPNATPAPSRLTPSELTALNDALADLTAMVQCVHDERRPLLYAAGRFAARAATALQVR
jgi:hypothetical protein